MIMKNGKMFLLATGSLAVSLMALAAFQPSALKAEAESASAVSSSSESSEPTSSETVSSSATTAPYDYVITSQVGYTESGAFKLASSRGVVDAKDGFYEADKPDSFKAYIYSNPDFDVNGTKITVFEYVATAVWYTVNGNTPVHAEIKTDNNSKYVEIPLTEKGQYLIQAYFDSTNNLKVTDTSNINWGSLLTWDNLIKLIEWAIMIFLGSGFFITLIKSKKIQASTTSQIVDTVTDTLNKKVCEVFDNFFKNTLTPILNQYNIKFSDTDEAMKTLLRCFTLSQEDTPEARLAIAKELEKLSTNDAATTDKVKAIVQQAIEENKAKDEANKKAIENAKQANESITPIDQESVAKKGLPTE